MTFRLHSLTAVRTRLLPLGCWLCLWLVSLSPVANALEIVSFGWEGSYQPGRWTPLRVSLSETEATDNPQFEVLAVDAEGNLNCLKQPGLATEIAGEYELRFKPGRIGTDVTVRLLNGDEVRAEVVQHTSNEAALPLNRRLMVILTGQEDFATVLDEYFSAPDVSDDESIELISLSSSAELPCDVVNWSSLETLILSTEIPLTSRQSETLHQWVRGGGHLLLSLGTDPEKITSSPLIEWVPFEPGKTLRLRDLSQFESYVGRSSRIKFSGRLAAIELASFDGQELLGSLDGTLVASLDYGFGKVTVSGVELSRPPLSSWEELPRLIFRLSFPGRILTSGETESVSQQLTDTGISELSTQLNLAQQKFSAVHRINRWLVMAAIAAYLLLIGLVDYLLVHRVLKRPELTWITFPIWLCLTACLAVWGGWSSNEIPLTVNQVDLIDIEQSQNLARVKSWMTAYNPQTQRLAVESSPNLTSWSSEETLTVETAILSWNAVPEDGFGGLYRQSGFEFGRPAEYHQDTLSTIIEDLPSDQWSTRSLTTDQFVQGIPLVESELEGSTLGSISGTVTHRLPGQLVDWMLVYRRRVYFPKPTRTQDRGIAIPPNQPIELTRNDLSASRDLKGYLTGIRQVQVKSDNPLEDTRIVVEQEAYNPFGTDPKQIVRMLSFHEAAGGREYTQLQNSALDHLDWSSYLQPHQAVLYGVLEAPTQPQAVNWSLNGEAARHDSQTTIVRCLLPVRLKNDARRELPKLE